MTGDFAADKERRRIRKAKEFTDTVELDLSTVEPSLAGPRRPQDRVSLKQAKSGFQSGLSSLVSGAKKAVSELRSLVDDLEDRVKGGPAKRQAASKKAAATRKRKANQRSAAAKKAARTRARAKK